MKKAEMVSTIYCQLKLGLFKNYIEISPMVQWLRIRLLMQGI